MEQLHICQRTKIQKFQSEEMKFRNEKQTNDLRDFLNWKMVSGTNKIMAGKRWNK